MVNKSKSGKCRSDGTKSGLSYHEKTLIIDLATGKQDNNFGGYISNASGTLLPSVWYQPIVTNNFVYGT